MPGLRIRDGKSADLAALCEIERRSFAADRLSPRSFRRLIGRPSALLRVAVLDGAIVGYHLVLTRSGTTVARLYSIVVAAAARGRGFGEMLLGDAERRARRAGAVILRLEVRADNAAAIRLYEQRGYQRIGTYGDYYADGCDALRYQKTLRRAARRRAGGGEGPGESGEERSPKGSGKSPHVMKMSRSAAPGYPVLARHSAPPVRQYEA